MLTIRSEQGQRCLDELAGFARDALDASGVVFCWIGDDGIAEPCFVHGVPDAFVTEYLDGGHRADPLDLYRLIKGRVTSLSLAEAKQAQGNRRYRAHADYFRRYDVLDEMDFIFWQDDRPVGALAALRRRGEPPLREPQRSGQAYHRILQFTIGQHPRLRTLRQARSLKDTFGLTDRQIEVLELARGGASNGVVAELLQISPSTVKTHMNDIFDKLGVSSRSAALAMSAVV